MSHKTLCGAVQSKFWGQTQGIFVGPYSEFHYLSINAGGFCSKHEHRHKWNRFFVIEGELKVTIFRDDGEDETVLTAGQFTDVPPGVYHEFSAMTDCKCVEAYWVENLSATDIERKNKGGIK